MTQDFRGAVALVLATSTGGIGQHVASLAEGLVAAGCTVTVCGPAMTENRFGFAERGARFVPVEIPANPDARRLCVPSALCAGPFPRYAQRSSTPTACAPAFTVTAGPAGCPTDRHLAQRSVAGRGPGRRTRHAGTDRGAIRRGDPGRLDRPRRAGEGARRP